MSTVPEGDGGRSAPHVRVRPATAEDAVRARASLPDLLPDRWRSGANRRSFAAEILEGSGADGRSDSPGRIVGHCRGIDNAIHPGSRTLVLETDAHLPDDLRCRVEDALLAAQREVSAVPLHVKVHASMHALRALVARSGGIAIQACPPWRYVVADPLRAWARDRAEPPEGVQVRRLRDADLDAVRRLEAAHYSAQHASWSPAAPIADLLEEMADAYSPASPRRERSVVLERGGRIAAAGLVWPAEEHADGAGCEVSLLAMPYESRTSRSDKGACLAAVVANCADGDVLCIDSHATELGERELMAAVPGRDGEEDGEWMAIVAIPVGRGPAPIPLPRHLLPTASPWIGELGAG